MEEKMILSTKEEKVGYLLAKKSYGFDDLVMVIEVLRGEGGCPWDMVYHLENPKLFLLKNHSRIFLLIYQMSKHSLKCHFCIP